MIVWILVATVVAQQVNVNSSTVLKLERLDFAPKTFD
jgi:hypothetical protein